MPKSRASSTLDVPLNHCAVCVAKAWTTSRCQAPEKRRRTPKSNSSKGLRSLPSQARDRKSTRLNSSHQIISYAVFCLKKNTTQPATRLQSAVHAVERWPPLVSLRRCSGLSYVAFGLVSDLKRAESYSHVSVTAHYRCR